jgi:peptidoglycan/xylan/chitin deacetylase (PgdA/CDA1 family)
MIFSHSQSSIKNALEYLIKFPFMKNVLHKLSQAVRGKCIVYFSLHRVLEDSEKSIIHPHFINKTAITHKQAHRLLTHIAYRLPFISLRDSIEYLKGNMTLNRSHAVLLIEVPYAQTIKEILPILEELRIPATFILNTESIYDGQMPWMDEIVFRLGSTNKKEISVNFIDRSFNLLNSTDRIAAANHFIAHISHSNPNTLRTRLNQLRETLSEIAIPPSSERICTHKQLEKISSNPLVSFACAGQYRLPFFDISLKDAKKEIIDAKNELNAMFNKACLPVFFYPLGFSKRRNKDLVRLMMDNGYFSAIGRDFGVCRSGDNMFHLPRLPLAYGVKGFERFELQDFSDAIDEFLLVTFAQEKKL